MKICRVSFATAILAVAIPFLHAGQSFGRNWMDQYNQNPQPAKLMAAVSNLSKTGYFNSQAHVDTSIGFFGAIFKANPELVGDWLEDARALPDRERSVLVAAAWLSGNPESQASIKELRAVSDGDGRRAANEMLSRGPKNSLADIPVDSVAALDLQWGAFLASGDTRYIDNVFAAFGSDRTQLTPAERYTLVEQVNDNARLKQVCLSNINRQSPDVRAAFEAALVASPPQPGV